MARRHGTLVRRIRQNPTGTGTKSGLVATRYSQSDTTCWLLAPAQSARIPLGVGSRVATGNPAILVFDDDPVTTPERPRRRNPFQENP